MNTTLSPYVRKSLEQLENIYAALRLNCIAMSKSDAMKIVGGRYKLERLVKTGKIRLQKPESGKAGCKWFCMAEDVFRHVKE